MEELIIELNGWMKQADLLNGVHTRIFDKSIYSSTAISNHRRGKQILADKVKIKKLIKAYEKEVYRVKNKLFQFKSWQTKHGVSQLYGLK